LLAESLKNLTELHQKVKDICCEVSLVMIFVIVQGFSMELFLWSEFCKTVINFHRFFDDPTCNPLEAFCASKFCDYLLA
jgi:hypothetical protein